MYTAVIVGYYDGFGTIYDRASFETYDEAQEWASDRVFDFKISFSDSEYYFRIES